MNIWNLDHGVEQSKPSSKPPPQTHSDPKGLLIFPHGGCLLHLFFGIHFPIREIEIASLCWLESFRLWPPQCRPLGCINIPFLSAMPRHLSKGKATMLLFLGAPLVLCPGSIWGSKALNKMVILEPRGTCAGTMRMGP